MSSIDGDAATVTSLDVRRAQRLRRDPSDAVLDVTSALLAEESYPGVTLPAVATRCGTSVAALMSRYPT
ncbi:TetR family transcriptional regulator [Mycolicibacterium phlei]